MEYPIFDTHAHYSARAFDADRFALLDSLPGKGVVGVCGGGGGAVAAGVGGVGSALAVAAADVCIVSGEGELFLTAPFTSAAAGEKLEGAGSAEFAAAAGARLRRQRVHSRLARQLSCRPRARLRAVHRRRRLAARRPGNAAQALIRPLLRRLLHHAQVMAHFFAHRQRVQPGFLRLFLNRAPRNRPMMARHAHPFVQRIVHQSSLLLRNVQLLISGIWRLMSKSAWEAAPSSSSTIMASPPSLRR